jgi:ribulose-phosphate 3-epimerase
MKISASFLSIKEDLKKNIKKLDQTSIDYLHLDIMDNYFVPNKSISFNEIKKILKGTKKPYDVHLMVKDIYKYIDDFKKLKPELITFHLEIKENLFDVIEYIKKENIKVGISIKPSTDINELKPYLHLVDLILLMSVEPGFGGQKFILNTTNRINDLIKLRGDYNFLIEVDGGINDETVKYCNGADVIVSGSFITSENDYENQVQKLKN